MSSASISPDVNVASKSRERDFKTHAAAVLAKMGGGFAGVVNQEYHAENIAENWYVPFANLATLA